MPPKPLETNPVSNANHNTTDLSLVFLAIEVAIELWILYYLYSLGKNECTCALNWRRTYIMVIFWMNIALVVARFTFLDAITHPFPAAILVMGAYFAACIFALQYVADLEKNKCACSDDPARNALVITSWFRLGLLIVLLAVGVLSVSFYIGMRYYLTKK